MRANEDSQARSKRDDIIVIDCAVIQRTLTRYFSAGTIAIKVTTLFNHLGGCLRCREECRSLAALQDLEDHGGELACERLEETFSAGGREYQHQLTTSPGLAVRRLLRRGR
jgi:hypothetical protein